MMNQQQRAWSPTVYSGFTLYNPTSKIDKTSINFSMWETTLKISIIPIIESETTTDYPKYDFRNAVSIFLTPIKAHLFAEILKKFKENPDKYNNYGIASPQAIITVDKPDTFGHPECGPVISIRKVNESGNVELSYSYECNYENYSSIVGFNVNNPKEFRQNTEIFKDADIDAMVTQLEAYYQAMTNAIAFSVVKNVYPYLDKIASKLGVDLSSSNNNFNNKRNSGFFLNQANGMNPTTTVGDMTNQNNNQRSYDAEQLQNLLMN